MFPHLILHLTPSSPKIQEKRGFGIKNRYIPVYLEILITRILIILIEKRISQNFTLGNWE